MSAWTSTNGQPGVPVPIESLRHPTLNKGTVLTHSYCRRLRAEGKELSKTTRVRESIVRKGQDKMLQCHDHSESSGASRRTTSEMVPMPFTRASVRFDVY